MNYRHAYHAGNFADCLKHAALVAVLTHLRKKDAPFAVIDTHGGRGVYDLSGVEPAKTGEAKDGILRLLPLKDLEGTLARYREIVRGAGEGHYPGSPAIAAAMLREGDRLTVIEKEPGEHRALAALLKKDRRCRVIQGDGYEELMRLLPPRERRGCILIDPPFEDRSEYRDVSRVIADASTRFPQGVFLFWYPAKEKAALEATIGELCNAGISPILKIELTTGGRADARYEGQGPRLTAAGLLVIHAPFGFEEEMRKTAGVLAQRLAQGPNAGASVRAVS